MKSTISLLGSFKGLEPGGLELMIRKWKRELERGREREKERKKDTGTQALMDKGALLAEMQAYISLVRWLLSYYTGWNFINSHSMDRLIHTKSLTLKRVTERSYWKESKQIPRYCFSWSQSWELHAALLLPVFQELIRNTESLRNGRQRKKKQHIGSFKVERPLTVH